MGIEHFGVVARVLHGGEGVGLATDGVELLGDLKGTALGGTFKDHVFDEVRQAALLGGLIPGPNIDPYPHGDGSDVWNLMGDNPDTVVEDGFNWPWPHCQLLKPLYDSAGFFHRWRSPTP